MILVLSALLLAGDVAVDAERAAWQFRRKVTISGDQSMASLVLPPNLSTKAGPGGRDFRLVDETGREVPYVLDWTNEREGLATWRAGIKDVRREKEETKEGSAIRSQWTIDLGAERTFTDLSVHLPDVAFAWHVRVEASVDGREYAVVQTDAALFDQIWNGERVRRTDVRFETPLTARHVRLTARSSADSRTLELEGASVTLRRRLKGDAWSVDVVPEPVGDRVAARPTTTRYSLDASSLLPFEEVEIVTDDAAFSRRVRLFEALQAGDRRSETLLGEGRVFRVRGADAIIAGETLRLPVRSGTGGTLYLEVDDGGSPALRGLRVRLHGSKVRLLFPASGKTFTLYYGNEATRAPAYDLEGLRPRLIQSLETSAATLDDEEKNPLFKREPPLRFAAILGASLDPSGWRNERVLAPIAKEDVYTLTLNVRDLGALRPDLADLRLVNRENRQVPFLVEHAFADERVALEVERLKGMPHRSAYRFGPPALVGGGAVRVSRIEIEVSDAFFERSARLLHSENHTERSVPFSISLARRPPSSLPLEVPGAGPLEAMTLEVDDGDNAPLDLRSAAAIVRVPRMVFKAAPGEVRLLLGNPAAETPRYDITSLRGELLSYSAIAATAGGLTTTDGGRETLWSRISHVPRNALVWTAIVLAIIVLVALTLRTLRNA